ncbi:hypothetical protein BAGA_17915 [Bacillus gaemokensis]|uniref:Uncharacterized protein n=1 Tax=Bacillus gaemokensis TaxID=574375 RepID=A0A073KRH5_9BACI|nr:hypothetical protein BAGA_17915 [Bacillus gaemokensis]
MELKIDLWLETRAINNVFIRKAESRISCSSVLLKNGIHFFIACITIIIDVLNIIIREERNGIFMYFAMYRENSIIEHCNKTVLNEYGIQRKNEVCFLKDVGVLKKARPIARLIKKPTTSVSVKRTMDKKYTSHI